MHAGLPLQSAFTEALLEPRDDKKHPMRSLAKHLGEFVHDVFDHEREAQAKYWPSLEDLFTNIDLAANTGHHLGAKYSPSELRTTRRVLLARMMGMLDERYHAAEQLKDANWRRLDRFFHSFDPERSAFVSLNWDTVIERSLTGLGRGQDISYKCGAFPASFPTSDSTIHRMPILSAKDHIPVIKIHGSVNWLYCDNCRQLYWFPAADGMTVALQLITETEGERFALSRLDNCGKWRCANCPSVPLTTRIATFSYLKALDFPMFEKSWQSAERLLRSADKWIFIGYSLPAADYEFKHLLKRVQASRSTPPEFLVVTGGKKAVTEATYRNYQGFFGRAIKRDKTFLPTGLTRAAIGSACE